MVSTDWQQGGGRGGGGGGAIRLGNAAHNRCYTSGISTNAGTGIATAEALLWSLPHNGTHLYGTTIEYIVSSLLQHTHPTKNLV